MCTNHQRYGCHARYRAGTRDTCGGPDDPDTERRLRCTLSKISAYLQRHMSRAGDEATSQSQAKLLDILAWVHAHSGNVDSNQTVQNAAGHHAAPAARRSSSSSVDVEAEVQKFCDEARHSNRGMVSDAIPSLAEAWRGLLDGTQAWLRSLGRTSGEVNTSAAAAVSFDSPPAHRLTFRAPPLDDDIVHDDALYGSAAHWRIAGRELRALRRTAEIYYAVTEDDSAEPMRPPPDVGTLHLPTPEYERAELTTVIGEVYVLADHRGRVSVPGRTVDARTAPRILMASISGVNMASPYQDRLIFRDPAQGGRIRFRRLWEQIQRLWVMALVPMVAKGAAVAVLTAIGGGAAALDGVREAHLLRHLYPFALRYVLLDPKCLRFKKQTMTLRAVVLCFPERDAANRRAYEKIFTDYRQSQPAIAVHILPRHDPLAVSAALARRLRSGTEPPAVCLLNPSDPEATRLGRIGGFFDGGDGGNIGDAEYHAVATTVLTMNRYVDPDLWTNARRQRGVRVDRKRCGSLGRSETEVTEEDLRVIFA